MRWIVSLALLVGLAGFPQAARAQDPLLATIDALSAEGRCVEAIALLEHARASQAALAGRRALCDARAGHAGDVVADLAVALRSPRDPWVRAHRDALMATLSATTSAAPTPAATPATASTSTAPSAPAPAVRSGESATALAAPSRRPRAAAAPVPAPAAPSPAPAAAPESDADASLACADAVEPNPYRDPGSTAPVQSGCGTPRTNPFHGSETIETNPYAIASWSPRDTSLEPNPYFDGGPTISGRRSDPMRPIERVDVEPNPYRPGRR